MKLTLFAFTLALTLNAAALAQPSDADLLTQRLQTLHAQELKRAEDVALQNRHKATYVLMAIAQTNINIKAKPLGGVRPTSGKVYIEDEQEVSREIYLSSANRDVICTAFVHGFRDSESSQRDDPNYKAWDNSEMTIRCFGPASTEPVYTDHFKIPNPLKPNTGAYATRDAKSGDVQVFNPKWIGGRIVSYSMHVAGYIERLFYFVPKL